MIIPNCTSTPILTNFRCQKKLFKKSLKNSVRKKFLFHNRSSDFSFSSKPRKGFLRNFAKFTGKQLCRSLYFNKVASLRPATLLK